MAKKNKNLIQISVEEFIDLLWPAYRYCIGRRSYSNSFIRDYAHIIRHNVDKFPAGRLEFFARDVRSYISDTLQWSANIHTENADNSRIVKDAYTLLAEYLAEQPDCDHKATEFYIDCANCTVDVRPWERPAKRIDTNGEIIWQPTAYDPEENYSYIRDYIIFANCLDRVYECVCEKGDQREVCDVVEAPVLRKWRSDGALEDTKRKWGKEWVCTSSWDRRPCEEYVKSVIPKFKF